MGYLRDIFRQYLGENTVLFTVGMDQSVVFFYFIAVNLIFLSDGDGLGYLKCGTVPGAYSTVDFGPGSDVQRAFSYQRSYAPQGPLINTEFYPGWLDLWGHQHSTVSTDAIIKTLDEMLQTNANVNFYMFFGGTNFAFTSGRFVSMILNYRTVLIVSIFFAVKVLIPTINHNQLHTITMLRYLKQVN